MCGICGIYGLEDKRLLKRMRDAISHRGPDGDGAFFDKNISLGHKRLSIIDLKKGDQPIYNEDRTVVVVYNGEIYNYLELKGEILSKGHKFYTNSDTEVLVHLYEIYGDNFADKLNGIFAFALYDSKKKRLLLVRDRMGIKPLFYTQVNEKLVFGSEIKAILQYEDVPREIDHDGLSSFFTFGSVIGNKTLFKGIKKLKPGSVLVASKKGVEVKTYLTRSPPKQITNFNTAVSELRSLLEKAVSSQLMSDVPLGAFLSGGIDSSTIVGLMSKNMKLPVETFTVGFGRADDELKYAKVISEHYGTNHHELFVSSSDIPGIAAKLAWHYDDPIWDAAAVPTYFVSEMARKKVKVVLTGEGADELFAGYNRYKPMSPMFFFVPRFIKLRAYNEFAKLFDPGLRKSITHQESSYSDALQEKYLKDKPLLEGTLDFEQKELLPNQLLNKVDRASMATSLEARVPFLDNHILRFSKSIPIGMKMKGLTGKYILRKAVTDLVPSEIINRKKQGFGASALQWIKDKNVADLITTTLDDAHIAKEGLDYSISKKLIKTEGMRKGKQAYALWSMFMLELWYRTYFENKGDKAIKL